MEHEELLRLRRAHEELNKKIERHEWRLLDLEKRVAHVSPQDPAEYMVDQQESYKEPILKKASYRPAQQAKKVQQPESKKRKIFIIMSAVAVLIVSYVLFHKGIMK